MPKSSAVWDYFDKTDNREKIRRKIGNCKEVLIVGESRSTYNPDPEKSDPARTLCTIAKYTSIRAKTCNANTGTKFCPPLPQTSMYFLRT